MSVEQDRLEQADAFVRKEFGGFVGAKLVLIRGAKQVELDDMYWDDYHPTIVMFFDNGLSLTVSQDEEGNGPGFLFSGEWS